MTISRTIKTTAAAAALSVVGTVAGAATVVDHFHATSAYNDAYGRYGSGHSAHLPSVHGGSDFDFVNHGNFTIYDDGSARLTGRIISDSLGADYGFNVDIRYQAESSATPKKELRGKAYSNKGGPVDTSTWSFYAMLSGTLTGVGKFAGITHNLFEAPVSGLHPFQVGYGANGKNVGFGGSGWFFHSDDASVNCKVNQSDCFRGDFNVNLAHAPVPAAGLLLPAALGAMGFAARRRRQKKTA